MRYGLIGEKLGHSYSAEIHSLVGGYEYELCELAPVKVGDFLRKREFQAINVTIPYKQTVIPYLDVISEQAERIGAVNTIVNKSGKLFGYNTDFAGMEELVKRIGVDVSGKKVLILGSGGTSKTATALFKKLGAGTVIRVSREKKGDAISYEEACTCHADAEIIVNATPCGMFPNVGTKAIETDRFPELAGVVDAVYNPLRTQLVLDAQRRKIPAAGGLYMLTAQAVYASALFLGAAARESDIERAYRAIYNAKRNIVLIGMPSCGKTTVGRQFAQKIGREFADIDESVTERISMSIAEFFAKNGEAAFRQIEKKCTAELAQKSAAVIAAGGGTVLDRENVDALKRMGTLVFLDRSPEKLVATADRPLSSDRAALMRLYGERYKIYREAADIRIDANGTPEEIAEMLYKELVNEN